MRMIGWPDYEEVHRPSYSLCIVGNAVKDNILFKGTLFKGTRAPFRISVDIRCGKDPRKGIKKWFKKNSSIHVLFYTMVAFCPTNLLFYRLCVLFFYG